MKPVELLHSIIMSVSMLLWLASAQANPPAANSSTTPAAATEATPPSTPMPNPSAAATQAADLSASLTAREHQLNQYLAQRIAKAQQLWLRADDSHEFLGLFQVETSGKPQGLLLLLPDRNQLADSPGLIRQLHRLLPAYGWSTLSISQPGFDSWVTDNAWAQTIPAKASRAELSDADFAALQTQAEQQALAQAKAAEEAEKQNKKKKSNPDKTADTTASKTEPSKAATKPAPADCEPVTEPAADTSSENKPSADKTKKSKKKKLPPCPKKPEPPALPVVKPYQSRQQLEQQYQQLMAQRFKQLIEQTRELSQGPLVLLAQGASGGLWIDYLLKQDTKKLPIQGLILVDGYQPVEQPDAKQAEGLCRLPLAILDLSSRPQPDQSEALQRKQQCQRQQNLQYRYHSLTADSVLDDEPSYSAGLIRGWLRQLAARQIQAK